MATVITSGIDYARFFDDLRAVIRQEVSHALANSDNPTVAEVGGLELAQQVTGLSKNTLYALVSKRGIPHSKRGNKLYFNRAELLAWVAEGDREVAQGEGVRRA
ncbi:helix-turn-helix domain-containing protein [Hymenobacter lutimineralis]|uniref:Helix-turn-helix domain-containing protein n=1 Tax=Hymenobacter lutimineralis TaxID=2606448 RepID=A0A5D6V455_9BACT|nr:helix-turn-helix domain-containing protein [Hymenobacter lutimineralis]TYZ10593.1 helix-turn-helix domain-containing protein [Hymenobacter lutimineralis]